MGTPGPAGIEALYRQTVQGLTPEPLESVALAAAEGLQLEQERSNAFWASVPADHFEQAKAAASTRARQQKA